MKTRFFLSLLFCALLFSHGAFSQAFEGIIEFKKMSLTDTVKYKYYVKGQNVRIEEIGSKGTVTNIMLVDIKANKVLAISPERKLYMEVENSAKSGPAGAPEITKTTNTKEVAGYKTTQWRVKNKQENTEVSYWVADANFDFFLPLLKTLNRKDKLATYFLQIDGNTHVFPMEASERDLVRQEKGSIVTTKVEKKSIDVSMFQIPSGFTKYQK